MRKFEKVCEDIFIRDVPDGIYNDIILPKRSTSFSAGYDFYSVISFSLNPISLYHKISQRRSIAASSYNR